MKRYNFTGCLKQGEPAEYYAAAEADASIAELERRLYDAESALLLRHDRALAEYTTKYPEPVKAPGL